MWLGFEFVDLLWPFFAHQLFLEFLLSITFILHLVYLLGSSGEVGFKNYAIGPLYYNALAGLVYAAFGDYGDRAMAARNILFVIICGWLFLCAWYKIRKKSDIDKLHFMFVSAKLVVLVCAVSVLVRNNVKVI